ncbi:helix-turn-helix domain-containing protein [Flagellimonas lutimaris]|uniref:helix-turn-helix domain-containing protein n=1 Tax=Flagellimonas lutimaris TaxID=475082 RepID=UPI003F5CCF6C
MEGMYRFESINDYNILNNHKTLHPLVNVLDLSLANPRDWDGNKKVRLYFGFYCVFLKEFKGCDLRYGRQYYDYQEGTLLFVSPGQIMDVETDGQIYQPIGHVLAFHPDLIHGTALGQNIDSYNFFGYHTNEALHISDEEREIVMDCLSKIKYELNKGVDKHSKKLIASNIELFLNYCDRFYDRQFITRDNENKGVLEKFEAKMKNYFNSDAPQKLGLPTVTYFADELNLSANYFGDLVKNETGKSAKDHIQDYMIEIAKKKTFNTDKSVSEIAYELGFKYPQHFNRFFKKQVGYTPNEYRMLN